uniref:Uncharacterized protein n=1 Tax=Knipowitschia caucasica TaxID=637954 RepID=A0AAV2KXF0_KNICA
MEIWLLLTAAAVVSSIEISLDQEQKSQTVSEGSSVSLLCRVWNKSSERSRVNCQNNSGWYCCHARDEIDFVPGKNSNWTELKVETKKPFFELRDWWLWIAVGSSGLVLLILLMCVYFVRRRQLKKREGWPIYANTGGSGQPSPRSRPTDSPPKTESPYENLQHPAWRYEHSRRLSPRT